MFSSSLKDNNAIIRIAEILIMEVINFGRLSIHKISKDDIDKYINERVSFIKFYIEFLEQRFDLEFNKNRIPYCYNSLDWSEELPIAGYLDEGIKVLPSQFIASLCTSWRLRFTHEDLLKLRLMRILLWETHTKGLEKGIEFLFDLQEYGFINNEQDLIDVILMALSARLQCDSEKSMIQQFYNDANMDTLEKWYKLDYETSWIEGENINESSRAYLPDLISRCFQKIEITRESENWDDWILNQSIIRGLICCVIRIYPILGLNNSIAMKTILSQLEEIYADSGVMVGTHISSLIAPYKNTLDSMRILVFIYKSKVGDGWEQQLYEERLIIPSRLRYILPSLKEEDVPFNWSIVSFQISHPYSRIFRKTPPNDFIRRIFFDIDFMMKNQFMIDFFASHNISDQNQMMSMINQYYYGKIDWENIFEYKDVDDAIKKVHIKESRDEAVSLVLRSIEFQEEGNYDAAIEHLLLSSELYPWNSMMYRELAIAYDMANNSHKAVDNSIKSIVLSPNNHNLWHSLGVILNKMEYDEESNIAFAMYNYLPTVNPKR